MATIFITGIDTDVGKSYVTGLLARYLLATGRTVSTQKLVQTGCCGISEDIQTHRRLMGIPLTDADQRGETCPYVFALPASPHLAAHAAGQTIEPEIIARATAALAQQSEYVLLEGAGGVYVPLTEQLTTIDYVAQQQYPVIVVSSAKLGSLNHTLLTLEALAHRALPVLGLVYNLHPAAHPLIVEDSRQMFQAYLKRFGYRETIIAMPFIHPAGPLPEIDFAGLFQHD